MNEINCMQLRSLKYLGSRVNENTTIEEYVFQFG